ncbi:MAG: hypothetical protein IPJ29_15375 [Chitinophagaceae bacterium]|nr:hypothetical protein [Chitinophagaceae bacterium]
MGKIPGQARNDIALIERHCVDEVALRLQNFASIEEYQFHFIVLVPA